MGAGVDGTIRIDSRIDPKGFNAGTASMSKGLGSMTSMLGKLATAIGVAFSVVAILAFARSSATAASSMQIMLNRFYTLFGPGADYAKAQLISMSDRINMADDDLMKLASTLQDTYVALGFTGRGAADLSLQTTALVEDLATFYDMTDTEVLDAIRSGLMGMTRGLKQFGIVADEDAIKAKAMAMGIWNGVGAINAQARAQAVLQLVIDGTTAAQGNAERTAHTWAGEVRGLEGAWSQFKEAVGNTLIMFAPIVAVVKTIVVWITMLANQFAMLIAMIFGIDVGARQAAGSVGDAADATGDLGDEAGKAGKAAKGALAPFDQLNVLAQKESGGGTAGAKMPSIEFPKLGTEGGALDEMKAKVKEFYEALVRFVKPAAEAFDRLKQAVEPITKKIWEGIKWAWDNVIQPLLNWVGTALVPAALDLLAAAATALNSALDALQPLAEAFWNNFLKPLGEWTGGAIITLLQLITDAFYRLSDWIEANPEKFQVLVTVIGSFIAALVVLTTIMPALIFIFELVSGAITLVSTVVAAFAAGATLAQVATTIFGAALAAIGGPVTLIIIGIAALIALIVTIIAFWPQISTAAQACWDWIVGIFTTAAEWFRVTFLDPLVAFWTPIFDWLGIVAHDAWLLIQLVWGIAATWFNTTFVIPVSGFFKGLWDGIVKVWGVAAAWFTATFIDPIRGSFNTVVDWLQDKWSKAWGMISSLLRVEINKIIGFINGLISSVVGGLNSIIGSFNSLGAKVPGWIKIPSIGAPSIPYLASGAVIPPNSKFLAVLGDQRAGNNIETPEALMRQIFSEEFDRRGKEKLVVEFRGTTAALIRDLLPEITREQARSGDSLIEGAAS